MVYSMKHLSPRFCSVLLTLLILSSPKIHAATITLGTIEESPQKGIAEFQPLADHLKIRLGIKKHIKFKVIVLSSLIDMKNALKSGIVDIYIDSPLSVENVCSDKICDITLRRWKKGVEKYHSVIFSRKDSGINTEQDLLKKNIAFEEPFSTSSFLLPKASLQVCCNITLTEKAGNSSGYVFSEDDENTMIWVIRRKIDAGAMSEASYYKLAKKRVKDLQIIHRTINVPRHVVAMRTDMIDEHRQMIIDVLSNMHKSDAGKSALRRFKKTVKFDAISEQEKNDIAMIAKNLHPRPGKL